MLTHPQLTPMCEWSSRVLLHVASRLDILKVKGYGAETEAAVDGEAKHKPHFELVKMSYAKARKHPPHVLLSAPNSKISRF